MESVRAYLYQGAVSVWSKELDKLQRCRLSEMATCHWLCGRPQIHTSSGTSDETVSVAWKAKEKAPFFAHFHTFYELRVITETTQKKKKKQLYNERRMLDMPGSAGVSGNGNADGVRTLPPTGNEPNALHQRTLCLQRMPYEGNGCRNRLRPE